MSEIYFIADTHFYHRNSIKYSAVRNCFTDELHMNEVLIDNWNKQVKPNDIVYHLGDFAFTNAENATNLLKSLTGRVVLCSGNHDHKLIKNAAFCAELYNLELSYHETKIDNVNVVMCHYPIRSWNGMHYGSYHLHGHTHGTCQQPGKSLDVGIDNRTDFCLWSWDEIKQFMVNR